MRGVGGCMRGVGGCMRDVGGCIKGAVGCMMGVDRLRWWCIEYLVENSYGFFQRFSMETPLLS